MPIKQQPGHIDYKVMFLSPTPALAYKYRLIYKARPDLITNENQTNILTTILIFYSMPPF